MMHLKSDVSPCACLPKLCATGFNKCSSPWCTLPQLVGMLLPAGNIQASLMIILSLPLACSSACVILMLLQCSKKRVFAARTLNQRNGIFTRYKLNLRIFRSIFLCATTVKMASMTTETPIELKHDDDSFSSYRRLCEVRMRRLERYKKAKSFCNLDDESNYMSAGCGSVEGCSQQPTRMSMPSPVSPQSPEELTSTFQELKSKMVSLMENDVNLFREMLTIADTLQELKMSREAEKADRSNSQSSLSDEEDEEDDLYICDGGRPFSNSMPGITRLYVDDEPSPNVQFFSRKNSVLRIPIPPRSSNRMNSTRRIPRRPSELIRPLVSSTSTTREAARPSRLNNRPSLTPA
ncbi:hypothetical protein L596_001451 [Steinernema carpocapsae]|uniref:Uncharacterized protein n=1 Tax=Steinernema carpocapsae TaxID=34508 RepID=A0A4U8ULH9_STECR|nr:hypothetical protein L596_001451 [Steinernema carpocapsae]